MKDKNHVIISVDRKITRQNPTLFHIKITQQTMNRRCSGLNGALRLLPYVHIPEFMNVILFGKSIFADVIKT